MIRCVDCGVEITTQAAVNGEVVEDDDGLHHRECLEPDAPAIAVEAEAFLADLELEEENERRRDHGDPTIPPPHMGWNSNHPGGPRREDY